MGVLERGRSAAVEGELYANPAGAPWTRSDGLTLGWAKYITYRPSHLPFHRRALWLACWVLGMLGRAIVWLMKNHPGLGDCPNHGAPIQRVLEARNADFWVFVIKVSHRHPQIYKVRCEEMGFCEFPAQSCAVFTAWGRTGGSWSLCDRDFL